MMIKANDDDYDGAFNHDYNDDDANDGDDDDLDNDDYNDYDSGDTQMAYLPRTVSCTLPSNQVPSWTSPLGSGPLF